MNSTHLWQPGHFLKNPKVILLKKNLLHFLILIVLPSLFFGLAQYKIGGEFSLYDEATHLGYAWDISHGSIPEKGDDIPPEILNEWSCETPATSALIPECNSHAPASEYPGEGSNYNTFHPPLYYLTSGLAARVISKITTLTFTQSMRVTSILWMVAGLLAFDLALKKWGIKESYALCASSLIPFIPVFFNNGTAATNDSPALLCSAFLLMLATKIFKKKKINISWLLLTVLCAAFIKGTFAFGYLSLALVVTVRACITLIEERHTLKKSSGWKQLFYASLIGITSLVGVGSWTYIQSFRGKSGWQNPISGLSTHHISGSRAAELLHSSFSGLLTGRNEYLRGFDQSLGYFIWLPTINILMIVAAWLVIFQFEKTSPQFLLATTTVASLLIFPILVQVREYISNQQFFNAVTLRYGLISIPLVVACWAIAVDKRGDRLLAVAPAVISAVAGLLSVFGVLYV